MPFVTYCNISCLDGGVTGMPRHGIVRDAGMALAVARNGIKTVGTIISLFQKQVP